MSDPAQPSFWRLARGFLHDHCANARRLSPDTVNAYRDSLERYLEFLASTGVDRADVTFEHFDRDRFKAWAAWMADTKANTPKTIELRLTAMRSLLRYAASEDLRVGACWQDAKTIKPPKTAKKPVEYLPRAATQAILAACDGRTAKSRRNRALLIFLYDSAARVSEAANTTVADLHLDGAPFVSLLGKGPKTRNMPIMAKTVEHLRVYLQEFHPAGGGGRPLFYSMRNGHPAKLSTDTITTILKQAASKARESRPEVPDRVHCHLLRKTRAMDIYQDGVPLALIMQMLGHEAMSTTSSFYAFATQQMMADAIKKATGPIPEQQPQWANQAILDALYRL
jgi:site-specific recombinase XerD